MRAGDLVKVCGTYPELVGVVLSFGWNESFKSSEEMNWNPNPDVQILTRYGKRTFRMLTLEMISESRESNSTPGY